MFLFLLFIVCPIRFLTAKRKKDIELLELAAVEEMEEQKEINKQERIEILDNALVKYSRLLDTLENEYKNENNEKKKAVILSKQIATLEKLNRLLEKREKLE